MVGLTKEEEEEEEEDGRIFLSFFPEGLYPISGATFTSSPSFSVLSLRL